MADNDWRFRGFQGSTTTPYNQISSMPNAATAPTTNAVTRSANPSPSGTDWNSTFSKIGGQQNPNYIGMPSNAVTRSTPPIRLAGDTTPPPSPGDIDNTFFGGPTPTPTPTPKPSLAFFRSRMSNTDSPLTARDRETYGAGSDFGFNT